MQKFNYTFECATCGEVHNREAWSTEPVQPKISGLCSDLLILAQPKRK